jgi:hypothetical protein
MQATALIDMGLLLPSDFYKEIVRTRPMVRPVLYAWQEQRLWEVTKLGYSIVPFTGHSRNFEGYDYARRKYRHERDEELGKDETSEVLNHPIQTIAANTLHRIAACLGHKLPGLHYERPPVYCYKNVYDSLAFDCKNSYLPELTAHIQTAVQYVETKEYWSWLVDHYGHSVPLKYDISIRKAA